METTRLRFLTNAYLASACLLTVGLVVAPMMRHWDWMAWPALVLVLVAGRFGWRAYRLWRQELAEAVARDMANDPRSGDDGPFSTGLSFTFERNHGIRVRSDSKGCPLWCRSETEYQRAFAEADDPGPRVNWREMTAIWPDDPQYPHFRQP